MPSAVIRVGGIEIPSGVIPNAAVAGQDTISSEENKRITDTDVNAVGQHCNPDLADSREQSVHLHEVETATAALQKREG